MAESKITASSGNVFADLGLPDADQLLAKADLAIEIRHVIEERGLTQAEAADLMGSTSPRSRRLCGAAWTDFPWSGSTAS